MENVKMTEEEKREFYRKVIVEMSEKIESVDYLSRLSKLAEYLYIYKKE